MHGAAECDPQMTPPSLPIDLRGSVDIIDNIGGPYGPPRPFYCGPLAAAPLVLMMHHRHKSVQSSRPRDPGRTGNRSCSIHEMTPPAGELLRSRLTENALAGV